MIKYVLEQLEMREEPFFNLKCQKTKSQFGALFHAYLGPQMQLGLAVEEDSSESQQY